MTVKRIVANIAADQASDSHKFYGEFLSLEIVMDHGWIVTFASGETAPVHISIASEGGSGAPIPDISVEVADVDEVYRRAKSFEYEIVYDLTDEP